MEQTLSQMLASPVFWIGTVVVGLIIEIVGSYIHSRFLEKWISSRSEKRQKKLEQEKATYINEVVALSKDPTELIIRYIRTGVTIIVILIVMLTLTTASLIMAAADMDLYVRFGLNVTGLCVMALFIALAKTAVKNMKKCGTANAIRKKRLLEEKPDKPAAGVTKRDDHESVNRS